MQSSTAVVWNAAGASAVLWTHYEWQCERTAGALRLYHQSELYAEEAVEGRASVTELSEAWLGAVRRLTVTLEELVGDCATSGCAEVARRPDVAEFMASDPGAGIALVT
jgi:hypothetical protein